MSDYNYSDYGYDFTPYDDRSPVLEFLKGLLGAILGAIPGTLIWILLGKIGYIASAAGLLIAFGIFFGFSLMVKDPTKTVAIIGIVTCLIVFLASIIIGVRVVLCWELSDIFKEYLPQFKEEILQSALEKSNEQGLGYTIYDLQAAYTDEMFNRHVRETFGIEEGTFWECFTHFSDLLETLDVKGKYYGVLVKNLLFGGIGGGALFGRWAISAAN